MPIHDIAFSKVAARTLLRMPRNTAERLRSKIRQYAANPASLGNNVEAIAGEFGAFRLKVGEWRIVFRLDHDVMHVRVITSRGGAYRVRR